MTRSRRNSAAPGHRSAPFGRRHQDVTRGATRGSNSCETNGCVRSAPGPLVVDIFSVSVISLLLLGRIRLCRTGHVAVGVNNNVDIEYCRQLVLLATHCALRFRSISSLSFAKFGLRVLLMFLERPVLSSFVLARDCLFLHLWNVNGRERRQRGQLASRWNVNVDLGPAWSGESHQRI